MNHFFVTVGLIVHYVAYNGTCLAAIIIGINEDGSVDLALFTSMKNVNGDKNFGMQFHQNIAYDEEKKPGTFHNINICAESWE